MYYNRLCHRKLQQNCIELLNNGLLRDHTLLYNESHSIVLPFCQKELKLVKFTLKKCVYHMWVTLHRALFKRPIYVKIRYSPEVQVQEWYSFLKSYVNCFSLFTIPRENKKASFCECACPWIFQFVLFMVVVGVWSLSGRDLTLDSGREVTQKWLVQKWADAQRPRPLLLGYNKAIICWNHHCPLGQEGERGLTKSSVTFPWLLLPTDTHILFISPQKK